MRPAAGRDVSDHGRPGSFRPCARPWPGSIPMPTFASSIRCVIRRRTIKRPSNACSNRWKPWSWSAAKTPTTHVSLWPAAGSGDWPRFTCKAAADLQPEWFAGFDTVGLTAGTSTLDETIDEVHAVLEEMERPRFVGGNVHSSRGVRYSEPRGSVGVTEATGFGVPHSRGLRAVFFT